MTTTWCWAWFGSNTGLSMVEDGRTDDPLLFTQCYSIMFISTTPDNIACMLASVTMFFVHWYVNHDDHGLTPSS